MQAFMKHNHGFLKVLESCHSKGRSPKQSPVTRDLPLNRRLLATGTLRGRRAVALLAMTY